MHRLIRHLVLCIGLVLAGPASAQVADLSYDVYVGGLHVFAFQAELTLRPNGYRVTATGETRGMVGWVSSWTLKLRAEGLDRNGRIVPQHYVAETAWKSRRRLVQLGFGTDGRYALKQTPPPVPDPDIEGGLPETLPPGIVDPLSFAVAASRALQRSGSCNQIVPIFDGQRRFDLVVKQLGPAVLPANDYSIYQGPALRCSLGVTPISGFRKSLRTSRERTAGPPIIWMATLRPDLPPLPVRYDGEVALGKIVIHLTGLKVRAATVAD